MKTHNLVSVGCTVAAFVGLAACTPTVQPAATPATPDTAKLAEAVKADVHDIVAAFNAKDIDKALAHDAADYVGMFHGQANVVGIEADRALTTAQMADPTPPNLSVSNEVVDVAKAGDMAVYRATYAYSFTDPKTKSPTTEHGNWVLGFKPAEGGAWKVSWAVVSDTPAPAAAAK